MELKHSFTVPVSLDRAWDVLLDVERVATCMPGASLDSVDGDDIAGKIKVKVGPITQVYAGKAHFTERNREAHVVTLEASGKETRGSGTASATVRSELVPDGDQTQVTVLTNLNVTGKKATLPKAPARKVQSSTWAWGIADVIAVVGVLFTANRISRRLAKGRLARVDVGTPPLPEAGREGMPVLVDV